MKIFKINNNSDFNELCKDINPHKIGKEIMQKKANFNFFLLKDISFRAANVLKQDALSIGAELVCNRDIILNSGDSNALLIANDKQIKELIKKESIQDFGLKNLSNFLKSNFNKPKIPKIMGVLNINDDSFNPKSRINLNNAIENIEKLINQGADYIDIGAVSSRPGSKYVGASEEFNRVYKLIEEIYNLKLFEKVKFSLDSFDEKTLRFALDRGFSMINDISANLELLKLAKEYNASYVLMHMQNNPQTMQDNPSYEDVVFEIDEFFKQKLEICNDFGVKDIYLDIGFGFGKTPWQNMILTKNLEHFLHFGYPLLFGASRKGTINFYSQSEVEDRLAGSLYLHLKAFENGASILRVHDVYEHKQLFNLHQAMNNINNW